MSVSSKAKQFYEEIEEVLSYLRARWQDEDEYEKLSMYLLPLVGKAEECDVDLVKMTEDPFGVQFQADTQLCWVSFQGSEYVLQYLREE